MDTLNKIATEYAGLLAIVGFLLALLSAASAVYFYYNPRRSSYRLSYKIFGPQLFGRRIRFSSEQGNESEQRPVAHYVDVWNSGAEPISEDVIRQQISIALQISSRSKGVQILGAEVLHETHPGMSNFAATTAPEAVGLQWTHFDPGMGVRLRLDLSAQVASDQIAVFGKGLRLNFKRVRQLSEIGGLPDGARKIVVFGFPGAVGVALGGPIIQWLSKQLLSGPVAYLAFVGVVGGVIALAIAAVLLGLGINTLIDRIFNTRSPTELIEGEPDFHRGMMRRRSSRDVSPAEFQVLTLREELRAAEAFAAHEARINELDNSRTAEQQP